ncbi:MAG: response regulator [Tissierellales bacterium]|nr:response regulator [Tissierellales bacterium]MBN2828239.1 response regulator [Tissierellales bacterium]
MEYNYKGRILVVDDEISIRTSLKILLEREGYKVDAAESANKALDLFIENEYDLVMTDIVMPKISGVELLRKIKIKSLDIPVIIMTGDPSLDTAVKALKAGAYDYLSKPISKIDLYKIVNQAIFLRNTLKQKNMLELENQQYQERLELIVDKRTKALQQTTQSIIEVMNNMMELRDLYTAGHQRRVGNLAAAIAEEMHIENRIADGIRITGYLHDIGKIAIPFEILNKPTRLTPLEFEIIKEHTCAGYNLLKNIDFSWPVAEIVWQHHERLNGSGYPRGLKKGQILLEANILAVADVVEAMASHRPYRASIGLECALKEIESNKGIVYDSSVADACLKLFKNNYEIEDIFINTQFPID